jgi:hypothetical protein
MDRLLDAEESADALPTLCTQVRARRLPQPVYPATGHGKTSFPGKQGNSFTADIVTHHTAHPGCM